MPHSFIQQIKAITLHCVEKIVLFTKDCSSAPTLRPSMFGSVYLSLLISLSLPPSQWPGHRAHPLLCWRRHRSDFDGMSYLMRRASCFTALLSLLHTHRGSSRSSGMKTKTIRPPYCTKQLLSKTQSKEKFLQEESNLTWASSKGHLRQKVMHSYPSDLSKNQTGSKIYCELLEPKSLIWQENL